jgi:Glycosyl transferase family 2/Dolichyl-phosphate-mannose-protein mannosyltransferase
MSIVNGKPDLGTHLPQDHQEDGITKLLSLAQTIPSPDALSDRGRSVSSGSLSPRSGVATANGQSVVGHRGLDLHDSRPPIPQEPVDSRGSFPGLRIVRFGVVASSCVLIQLLVLKYLSQLGVRPVLANGIGFIAAAQAYFLLNILLASRDRRIGSARRTIQSQNIFAADTLISQWTKFSVIALIPLAVNGLVFAVTLHNGVELFTASCTGILSGAIVVFSVNLADTHQHRAREKTEVEPAEKRPSLESIRSKVQEEGVAFFLPAFNESENLKILVPKLVGYFRALSCHFTVIIVDDGSTTDDTHETAERMADVYGGYVRAVHHDKNMGYGATLRTGLRSALSTGHGLIAFCDADNQFDIESFGTLLVALQNADADLAVGYRIDRADSLKRRVMGVVWHWLSTRVLDFGGVRDVDCGFKVFTRQVLVDVIPRLRGDYATISPEIVSRATTAGYTVAETGITHRPRAYGRQTGSDPKVVVRSLVRLFQLRRALRGERVEKAQRLDRRELDATAIVPASDHARDYVAWFVGIAATLVSVTAFVITDRLGAVLLYKDSMSHMEIARRVLDGTSPGLAQLGAVWLPFPHIVMLPLVWNNTLYHNGVAGSLPSNIAFVAMVVLMYRLVRDLTGHKFAGIIAAAILVSNINMLYMQSTPMTEALLYCFIIAMIFYVQRWADTGRYQYLVLGGLASLIGTLTRYESWPILACLILAVIIIAYQRTAYTIPGLCRASVLDYSIVYVAIAGLGIGAWLLWNWAILKNPLYFQDGQFGKPSLWVSSSDPVVGNWLLSFKTYWYATTDTVTWPLLAVASIGLAMFCRLEWRTKLRAARSLPVLSLLIIFPFFVICVLKGQRPIGVPQVQHNYYNVRFGLMMLMPVSVFIGYLTAAIGRVLKLKTAIYIFGCAIVALSAFLNYALISGHHVATYDEGINYVKSGGTSDQNEVVAYLKSYYLGGRVLMESYSNEFIAFAIPTNQLVYEGSYRQWLPALENPATNRIKWIIMSCQKNNPDLVCSGVGKSELRPYVLTYHTPDNVYRVYMRRM